MSAQDRLDVTCWQCCKQGRAGCLCGHPTCPCASCEAYRYVPTADDLDAGRALAQATARAVRQAASQGGAS